MPEIEPPDSNPLLLDAAQDYLDSIEYDEKHAQGVQTLIDAITKHAASLTPEDNFLELARLQVELNDSKERLLVLLRLIRDKKRHYEETFLPQYKERLAESNVNFDGLFKAVCQLISADKTQSGREQERRARLQKYVSQFEALNEEQRGDEAIRSNYYHVLSNLMPNDQ